MPCEQPACPSYRADIKNHGAVLHRGFNKLLARPLRHNFHAGQNVRVKTQPVLARADVIQLELFRAGHCNQHGQHQNKQLLHCVLLKMGMKKPRCVCIVVKRVYQQERGTASEPFPIDWYLAGVAFSCISQSLSPCRYHRRVAATKLTTSNTFLILCLGYHIYPFL